MLTQDEVKRHFNYNPISGKLTWAKAGIKRKQGAEAGNANSHGYRVVGLERKIYKVHKIIVCYMTGEWLPTDVTVDHINGNRLDNRWINLRIATKQENCLNRRRANKNSASGVLGIRKISDDRYDIYSGGKRVGFRRTKKEAIEAKRKADKGEHIQKEPRKVNKCRSDSETGFTGVKQRKGKKRTTYIATAAFGGKYKYIGSFGAPEEAHAAYEKAHKEYYGG